MGFPYLSLLKETVNYIEIWGNINPKQSRFKLLKNILVFELNLVNHFNFMRGKIVKGKIFLFFPKQIVCILIYKVIGNISPDLK